MFCTKCGQKLNDGDLFCSSCGTRVLNTNTPNAVPDFQEKSSQTTDAAKNENLPITQSPQSSEHSEASGSQSSFKSAFQSLKNKTIRTCPNCAKKYELSKLSYLYIALIILGVIFALVINTIIGIVMISFGVIQFNSRACPYCGFSKRRLRIKATEQKAFSKIKNKSNTAFYKVLYELDTKYKAKIICNVLLIILSAIMIIPLITKTVDVKFYTLLELEKTETESFINILGSISETWAAIMFLPWYTALLFSLSTLYKKVRLSIVPRITYAVIGTFNIIAIAILNEKYIIKGLYSNMSEGSRELIDSGTASMGAESFWFIFINIFVVALAFMLYEFEKAILINKNAVKPANSNPEESL
ncbi:MAG: zinc ribbon domain-containing protein [Clostridia bacterium]|nr:zinc ribbon domain-containing protein [Clostridia bacterium]